MSRLRDSNSKTMANLALYGARFIYSRSRRLKSNRIRENYRLKWFAIFLVPAMIIYTIFWAVPILSTLSFSFTNWSGITAFSKADFVGLKNFRQMAHDPIFIQSLKNNFQYGIVMVIAVPPLSFFIAYLLDTHIPFKKFFGFLAYIPAILPTVVVMLLWRWILNAQYGLVNTFLKAVGLEQFAIGWLSNVDTALWAVTFVSIWKTVPTYTILALAGLQQIPVEYKEAAIIDGANEWQRIIHIIIPSMRSVFYTIFTLVIIDVFRVFELVYIMTEGGPGYYSTEMLLTYMYKSSFSSYMAGYGSAIATTTILIVLVITALNLKFSSRSEED